MAPSPSKLYYITNGGFLDSHGLTVKLWGTGDVGDVGKAPQNLQWQLKPVEGRPNLFYFWHKAHQKYLDGDGKLVFLDCDEKYLDDKHQLRWRLKSVSGKTNTYYIVHEAFQKYLNNKLATLDANGSTHPSTLTLWKHASGSLTQLGSAPKNLEWRFVAVPSAKRLRKVRIIATCGPSASGKSTLTEKVAKFVKSPFYPIQADNYFKKGLPSCRFRKHCCWEQRSSVDHAGLIRDLRRLVRILETAETVPEKFFVKTPRKGKIEIDHGVSKSPHPLRGKALSDDPVYLVVEGFKLFLEPDFLRLCHRFIMLDASEKTLCKRRWLRSGGKGPPTAAFNKKYHHIYWHHKKERKTMRRNAQARARALHRKLLVVDAEQSVEAMVAKVTTAKSKFSVL